MASSSREGAKRREEERVYERRTLWRSEQRIGTTRVPRSNWRRWDVQENQSARVTRERGERGQSTGLASESLCRNPLCPRSQRTLSRERVGKVCARREKRLRPEGGREEQRDRATHSRWPWPWQTTRGCCRRRPTWSETACQDSTESHLVQRWQAREWKGRRPRGFGRLEHLAAPLRYGTLPASRHPVRTI